MFRALVRLVGEYKISPGVPPKIRHLHPWEICFIHGGIPEYDWQPLRYSISALGQMVSPIQFGWITGQFLAMCDEASGFQVVKQDMYLWNHSSRVFQAVADSQPSVYRAQPFQMYIDRIRNTLAWSVNAALGPAHPLPIPDANASLCCPWPLSANPPGDEAARML